MKKNLIMMLGLAFAGSALASDVISFTQVEEVAQEEKNIDKNYFAIQTLPFFLSGEETEGKGDGRIFPFADAKILEIQDDKIKLEITGWKPENVPHAIYAQKGKRIMKALIAKNKAENIQILGEEMDEDTGQNWQQVSLIIWADMSKFIGDEKGELLDQYGQKLLVQACAGCHAAIASHHHLANQWPGIMKSMKRFVSIDDHSWTFLQYYLQHNAKDMVKSVH